MATGSSGKARLINLVELTIDTTDVSTFRADNDPLAAIEHDLHPAEWFCVADCTSTRSSVDDRTGKSCSGSAPPTALLLPS